MQLTGKWFLTESEMHGKTSTRVPQELLVFQTIMLKEVLLESIMLVYNYLRDQNLTL